MEIRPQSSSATNICRTCLKKSDSTLCVQELIEHKMKQIKLIDILVFLDCLESNDDKNWPQVMCSSCVSTALIAYSFKLNCLKANATLSRILTMQSSHSSLQRSEIDRIDINVVYQDHEYDIPLFSNTSTLDLQSNTLNKELTPLPPVSEITSTEQLPRKEGEKKFACTQCSKSFTRIYGLRYHMAKHINALKYLCPKCGKRFHNSNGLNQHLISHSNIAHYKCGFCNRTYKSRQSLKNHFRVAHSSNRHLFVCVTCGKSFTAKSTLMMHIKTHNGEKRFQCPNCPKKYTRASYLKTHSFTHTGQGRPRPFICDKSPCDRQFTTKHSLLVHIAHTHATERPHKCDICLKRFATNSGLKIHIESHIKKENDCKICGKKLPNKRMLQKHIKEHDNEANMILEPVVVDVFFDQVY